MEIRIDGKPMKTKLQLDKETALAVALVASQQEKNNGKVIEVVDDDGKIIASHHRDRKGNVRNTVTGNVTGPIIQAGNITGGIRFNGKDLS